MWYNCLTYNTNHYPFGMTLPGRSYKPDDYRYSFNGKEKDTEGMGGSGSTYDYGFRIYNPNIAKFLSVDPLTSSYPWYTPYQFAGNKPIWAIDLDGLEEAIVTQAFYNHGLGKTCVHIPQSKELTKIWNSVNRADKFDEYRVYYGVMRPSTRNNANKGETVDLTNWAQYIQFFGVKIAVGETLTEQERIGYENARNLFITNGLSVFDILDCGKQVFGVFLNPEQDEKQTTFAFFHELDAHLKNLINGITRTPYQDHSEFYNYTGNPDLLINNPMLQNGENSPSYETIPENSQGGKIKQEIERLNSQSTTNSGTDG